MNKSLVIVLTLIILVGGGVIFWQLSGGEDEGADVSNPTPVSESTSSIDPVEESSDDDIPDLSNESDQQILTADVVAEYSTAESCWTIIDGGVYDITAYVPRHPGGIGNIVQVCGTDGTELFEGVGQHESGGARGILEEYYLGPLEG